MGLDLIPKSGIIHPDSQYGIGYGRSTFKFLGSKE